MVFVAVQPAEVRQLLISRPIAERRLKGPAVTEHNCPVAGDEPILEFNSALGFPSKTSAEIAPDHRELSDGTSGLNKGDSAQTRINIAVCTYWCYFHDALENGGNRLPLPAHPPKPRGTRARPILHTPKMPNHIRPEIGLVTPL